MSESQIIFAIQNEKCTTHRKNIMATLDWNVMTDTTEQNESKTYRLAALHWRLMCRCKRRGRRILLEVWNNFQLVWLTEVSSMKKIKFKCFNQKSSLPTFSSTHSPSSCCSHLVCRLYTLFSLVSQDISSEFWYDIVAMNRTC